MEQEDEQHSPPTPPTQPPARPAAQAFAPVAQHERIAALDILRGFAIFGIFTVNIAFFAEPLFQGLHAHHLADVGFADQLAWATVKIFGEYKFVSLFSLLFGIGLVVQMGRATERRQNFVPVYVRRLLVLAGIGLVHGVLIWYGDILAMYAIAGFLLLALRALQPRSLILLSVVFLFIGWLFISTCLGLGMLSGGDTAFEDVREEEAPAEAAAETGEPGDDRWARWWAAMRATGGDLEGDAFAEAEMIAYKEGPFLAALIMRTLTFAAGFFFSFLLGGFAFRILAMFLLGAALMKLDFFDASRRPWHWRLFIVGFAVGLPLETLVAVVYWNAGFGLTVASLAAESLHYLTSAFLFLGYVGGVTLLAHSRAARPVTAGLAAVGRMALSNYLLQSVVAAFIMYWWGLALFGEVGRVQQLGLVVMIFLGQVGLSVLWLRFFRFGPMEWLWRSMTYQKVQPLTREHGRS